MSSHLVYTSVILLSGQMNSDPQQGREHCKLMLPKGSSVPLQSRHFPIPPSPICPHPLRATLEPSCYRILRGLRFRGDDSNVPTAAVIFAVVLGEGSYPLARRLLRVQMIEITWSQAPKKVLWAAFLPHQWTKSKKLLPWSCQDAITSNLSKLCACIWSTNVHFSLLKGCYMSLYCLTVNRRWNAYVSSNNKIIWLITSLLWFIWSLQVLFLMFWYFLI